MMRPQSLQRQSAALAADTGTCTVTRAGGAKVTRRAGAVELGEGADAGEGSDCQESGEPAVTMSHEPDELTVGLRGVSML